MALALVLAVLVLYQQGQLESKRTELRQLLDATGVADRRPQVLEELRREPDAYEARVLVGRALLADVLDSPRHPEEGREDQTAKLQTARALAVEVLSERPASWSALLVKGAAIYLERSLARDDRLITQYREWEAPLEASHRNAPGEVDPQRFLTMAYLEIWPMLSQEKRARARDMLGTALEQPDSHALFLEPWLRGTVPPREALQALPGLPHVWQEARNIYITAERWQLVTEAHAKWLDTSEHKLRADLAEARARTENGDLRHGRAMLAKTAASLRPDTRWVGLFGQVMQALPPGPVHHSALAGFQAWLSWNLERCLFDSCRLDPTVVARLSRAVEGDLVSRARHALAAQDLIEAEGLERQAQGARGPNWNDYWMHKASFFVTRGDLAAARSAILRIRTSELHEEQDRARRRQDLLLLAALRARAETGGPLTAPHNDRISWDETDWVHTSRTALRLILQPAHLAAGLELHFPSPLPRGAAIEIIWDGDAVGSFAIGDGRPALQVAVDATPRLHILDIRALGGRTALAQVRLLD